MIRDNTHDDAIERWAKFIKENPRKWRKIHNRFIDSQYDMHKKFLKRLIKEVDGKQKIIKLYNIKNIDGYPSLKE